MNVIRHKTKIWSVMKISIVKAYLTVTLIVAAVFLGVNSLGGSEVTLNACGFALLVSSIATAIVMAIWFAVGYWVSGPVVKFLNGAFELMGR